MSLTYDLVFRIIMSGAYLLYYLRTEFQIWCVDFSWNGAVMHTSLGHIDIGIDF